MAHGAPDWFNVNPMELFYSLSDLGELAARLGSPSRIDRRGKVVWYDTFSGGLSAWDVYAYGGGARGIIVTAPSVSPGGALMLDAGTVMGGNTQALTHLVPPLTRCFGVEWYWTHPGTRGLVMLIVSWTRANTSYMAGVRYDCETGRLYFMPIASPMVLVKDFGPYILYPNTYHNYKLVLDTASASGVRIMVDGEEFDISPYTIYSSPVAGQDGLDLTFVVDNLTDAGTIAYIDDIIYTWGE